MTLHGQGVRSGECFDVACVIGGASFASPERCGTDDLVDARRRRAPPCSVFALQALWLVRAGESGLSLFCEFRVFSGRQRTLLRCLVLSGVEGAVEKKLKK